MKKKLKSIIENNWLFIFMIIVLQVKSMLLLSMLRTPDSAGIDIKKMYFGIPPIWAHIAIVTLITSIILLFKKKGQFKAALIIDLIVTILFVVDIWYYRVNGTFLSIRHIMHNEIVNPLGKSLLNFKTVDLLFLVDFIIIFIAYRYSNKQEEKNPLKLSTRIIKCATVFIISVVIIGTSHYMIDITKKWSDYSLFRIAWAPFQTFGDMSPLGYHGYDIYYYASRDKKLTEQEVQEVSKWLENNKEDIPDNKYKGMVKGKNVIAIQVESLENFVINKSVYGQEITPTLNKLLGSSLYFNNIYEQNNSGTSSDADLLVNTSVLPVRSGSTFFGYPWTAYNSLQKILKDEGYKTISTHPEVAGNWNWSEAHKAFGADEIWDISYFNLDEVIGLGLSDESYLRQISQKLKDEKEPFYTFFPTLTSHGPFEMPDEKKYLDLPKELDENILGAYFQSIRYTDECIKMFIEELEKNGQLENTVLMIYGDHGGVHKFYNDLIQDAPLEGDWWKDDDKKIPLIIYSNGIKGETINKAGGQVDFLPTISYLLGVDREKFDSTSMGRVLVNTERDATILNYGDIKGTLKNEEEEKHIKESFKIADLIIQGNYFKNNK